MKPKKRCGGGSIKIEAGSVDLDRIRIKVLPDIGSALEQFHVGYKDLMRHRPKKYAQQYLNSASWQTALRIGMPERLDAVMAKAEQFIDEAIAHDPRLVRKGAFIRTDDPSIACGFNAAAIAAEEDNPYFARPFRKLNSQRAWGECVRIVLSTDTDDITEDHAAAFIATAKLAQQFRPLDIWWQGAWLDENTRSHGTAFLVPMLHGDLDFTRIQFVLSHPNRDNLSHKVAWGISCKHEDGKVSHISGGRAEYSLHPEGCDFFVAESGINPWASAIAFTAACWAGLEYYWTENVDSRCAVQTWAPNDPNAKPALPTEEDKKRWEKQEAEAKAKWEKNAKERMTKVL